MKKEEVEALPSEPAALKREIVRLSDIVASYETAKKLREEEAKATTANLDHEQLESDVFSLKADLEGLADGSVDWNERQKVVRRTSTLLDRLLNALRQT